MLTVSREAMLNAVSVLSKIPVREGVATSEQLKIDTNPAAENRIHTGTLLLYATGGINCRCKLPVESAGKDNLSGGGHCQIAVSRPAFCVFCDVARGLESESPFELELKGDILHVKNGRRTLKLPTKEIAGNYGCLTEGQYQSVEEPKALREKMRVSLDFASNDKEQLDLFGVYLSPLGVLAGDKKAGVRLKASELERQFLPRPFAELLAEQSDGKLYVSRKTVQYRSKALLFEHALPVKDFFPYDKFQKLQKPPDGTRWLEFAVNSLQSVARRFAPYMSITAEEERVLLMKLVKGKSDVAIRVRIGGNEVRESAKLAQSASEDTEYEVSAERMLKFCSHATDKESISMATTEKVPLFWFKSGSATFYLSKIGKVK